MTAFFCILFHIFFKRNFIRTCLSFLQLGQDLHKRNFFIKYYFLCFFSWIPFIKM